MIAHDSDPAEPCELAKIVGQLGYTCIVVRSAGDLKSAISEGAVGCILLDISMAEHPGRAVQQWRTHGLSLFPVIAISAPQEMFAGVEAMKAGAEDCLPKPVAEMRLREAIEPAIGISRSRANAHINVKAAQESLATLTPTEALVARFLAQGNSSKAIAGLLGRSVSTIHVHRGRILRKLKANSAVDLIRICEVAAVQQGGPLPSTTKPSEPGSSRLGFSRMNAVVPTLIEEIQ